MEERELILREFTEQPKNVKVIDQPTQEINIDRTPTKTSSKQSSDMPTYRLTILGSFRNSNKYHARKARGYNDEDRSSNNVNSDAF